MLRKFRWNCLLVGVVCNQGLPKYFHCKRSFLISKKFNFLSFALGIPGNLELLLTSLKSFSVIAMLVLIFEVYFYKKKSSKESDLNDTKVAVFTKSPTPYSNFDYSNKVTKGSVLLGTGNFIPTDKRRRISFITVNPRE